MKEDCGAFAADCLVMSCCCQCLVLQVTVFVFLKIPRKLAHKMNKFVKRRRLRRRCGEIILQPTTMEDVKEEYWSGNRDNIAFDEEGSSRFNSMEQDIEQMLKNNEFVFGSFWRQQDSSSDNLDYNHSLCSSHSSCVIETRIQRRDSSLFLQRQEEEEETVN